MKNLLVHKSRFVRYSPQEIHQFLSTKDYTLCLRSHQIDIYKNMTLIYTLVGSFSGIAATDSLIVAYNGTLIHLYNIDTFSLESTHHSPSEVWAIEIFDNKLAVASQNIQVYSLPSFELIQNIHFPHKALVIRYSDESFYISSQESQLWKLSRSGQILSRIPLKKKTIAWDILVTDEFFIAGDSLGSVHFYFKDSLTLFHTIKNHHADVLTLASNSTGNVIYSSGIDRVIYQYNLITVNNTKKWITSADKRYHSHDVKSLLVSGDLLISGGVDANVIFTPITGFPNVKPQRRCPFPLKPIISICPEKRLVLARFPTMLKLWKLGSSFQSAEEYYEMMSAPNDTLQLAKEQQVLPLESNYKHILDINLNCKSPLLSSAISPDGSLIIVSDNVSLKMFAYTMENEISSLQKLNDSPLPPAQSIIFSADSKRIVIAGTDCKLYIVDITNTQPSFEFELVHIFAHHTDSYLQNPASSITNIAISGDGTWLCSSDLLNRIHVFNLITLKHHWTLPHFKHHPTTLSFNPFSPTLLFLTLTDNSFYVYNMDTKNMTVWSQKNSFRIPDRFLQRNETIRGVTFITQKKLILWGYTYYATLDMQKPLSQHLIISCKRKQNDPNGNKVKSGRDHSSGLIIAHRFPSLLHMELLNSEELVVFERPELHMVEELPPSFYKKKYGV